MQRCRADGGETLQTVRRQGRISLGWIEVWSRSGTELWYYYWLQATSLRLWDTWLAGLAVALTLYTFSIGHPLYCSWTRSVVVTWKLVKNKTQWACRVFKHLAISWYWRCFWSMTISRGWLAPSRVPAILQGKTLVAHFIRTLIGVPPKWNEGNRWSLAGWPNAVTPTATPEAYTSRMKGKVNLLVNQDWGRGEFLL